jgi:hypothetical protein
MGCLLQGSGFRAEVEFQMRILDTSLQGSGIVLQNHDWEIKFLSIAGNCIRSTQTARATSYAPLDQFGFFVGAKILPHFGQITLSVSARRISFGGFTWTTQKGLVALIDSEYVSCDGQDPAFAVPRDSASSGMAWWRRLRNRIPACCFLAQTVAGGFLTLRMFSHAKE